MDFFDDAPPDITAPASGAWAIAFSGEPVNLPFASRGIYVGAGGDLEVEMVSGHVVTFKALSAGMIYPMRIRRVISGTARDLLSLV